MMTTKAAYFYDLKVISDDKENVENLINRPHFTWRIFSSYKI